MFLQLNGFSLAAPPFSKSGATGSMPGRSTDIMVKLEIITSYNNGSVSDEARLHNFDESVKNFIKKLSEEGHAVISVNTQTLGSGHNYLRTEVLYRECITREVILEKISS